MTYNWNTMVEITVPTGTNGWLYSGEVIINGVKVRFPVGVPTSVPEPAAVLLKKMIELEQEEDANTAKPQNHYVGDVTIPAGKTLTLEKGAKFVDNSGPSEVVILPETVLTGVEIEGATEYPIMTEPLAQVEVGKTYTVTYNGTAHETTASFDEGDGMYSLPFEDGGVALLPESVEVPGVGMVYGMVYAFDGSTPITLSIVEKAETASAGGGAGVCMVTVTCESEDGTTFTNVAKDKAFADVKASYDAGGLLWCRLVVTNQGQAFECHMVTFMDGFMFAPVFGALSGVLVLLTPDDAVAVMKD